MASNAKRKTTMAKLNREAALRERRARKQARKDARKLEAAAPPPEPLSDTPSGDEDEAPAAPPVEQPAAAPSRGF
jgi:hypothetical protein